MVKEIKDIIGDFSFDHVGIAVSSLDESLQTYKSLGMTCEHIEEVDTEKVRIGFIDFQNKAHLELLESTDPSGPIAQFIKKQGRGGVHHISLRVHRPLEEVVKDLKAKGIQLINETPRPGSRNTRIVFIHPRSTGGVLLELNEEAPS